MDFVRGLDHQALIINHDDLADVTIIHFVKLVFGNVRALCFEHLTLSIKRKNYIFLRLEQAHHWEISPIAFNLLGNQLAFHFVLHEIPFELVVSLSESIHKIDEKP